MNQLVASHTVGQWVGTAKVATTVAPNSIWSPAGQITLNGFTGTSGVLSKGDTFTIAGVYMVNGQTKAPLATLQQFVVTSAVTSDATGTAVVSIAPAIVTTGGFQNVSAAPAAGAVVNPVGSSGASTQYALAFDRDAIMLAAKELVPYSVGMGKTTTDDQTRIPIRVQQMPDIRTNQEILRFDVMVAWATLYDQLGIKIATT
jgi:hypothetical protein